MSDIDETVQDGPTRGELLRELGRITQENRRLESENRMLRHELERLKAADQEEDVPDPVEAPAAPPEAPKAPATPDPEIPLRATPSGLLDETVKDMGKATREQLDDEVARQLAARRQQVMEARNKAKAPAFVEVDTQITEEPPAREAEEDPLNESPTNFLFPDDPGEKGAQPTNVVTLDEILSETGQGLDEDS